MKLRDNNSDDGNNSKYLRAYHGFISCLGTKGTVLKKGSEQVLDSDGIFRIVQNLSREQLGMTVCFDVFILLRASK